MSDTRIVERREDMSPLGRLVILMQPDGDVIVAVRPDPEEYHGTSVEFCQPLSGGGRSRHTIRALRELAQAMERDNAEAPIPGLEEWTEEAIEDIQKRIRTAQEYQAEIDQLRVELAAAKDRVITRYLAPRYLIPEPEIDPHV